MSSDVRAFDSWLSQYVEAAYVKAQAVNASTETTIATSRGIYVGADGDVQVHLVDDPGTAISFSGVKGGTILPVAAVKIGSGTTVAVVVLF